MTWPGPPSRLDEQVGAVLFGVTFLLACALLAVARRLSRS